MVTAVCLLVAGSSFTALAQEAKELNVNGLKIIYKKTGKEVVTASVFIRGGTANYGADKQGIEPLALHTALNGGFKGVDKDALAAELEKLGTEFSESAAKDYSSMTMTCLKDHWDRSWQLFTGAIMSPAMDEQEFNVYKDQLLANSRSQESNPDQYLRKLATEQAFKGTDYAKFPNGTPQTLEKITLAEAKAHYQSILGRQRMYIVVVGNVEAQDLLGKVLATLATLPEGKPAPVPTFNAIKTTEPLIQDRKMATNYILGQLNGPKYNSPDGPLFEFAMNLLYDRYFVELRTKRSLSYAPAAGYSKGNILNPSANLYISTIDPKQSLEVMTSIINDLKKEGFTASEVKNKKKEYLTEYYLTNESSQSQAGVLGFCEASGNWKLFEEINKRINEVTPEMVNTVFARYMNSINWTYLGDKSKVAPQDFRQLEATKQGVPPSKVNPLKKG